MFIPNAPDCRHLLVCGTDYQVLMHRN